MGSPIGKKSVMTEGNSSDGKDNILILKTQKIIDNNINKDNLVIYSKNSKESDILSNYIKNNNINISDYYLINISVAKIIDGSIEIVKEYDSFVMKENDLEIMDINGTNFFLSGKDLFLFKELEPGNNFKIYINLNEPI